ncbi:endonuclease Q family protein [Anaerobacillus sp. MEB173]|uniref:endonuclease Q family protein n=1 Tax=Anaerobacillus sp. MEB173 TaxID=3383345 RepID=UPI003F8E1A93
MSEHFYVDLHIHIGRTNSGKPVKITGAKSLTITNILTEAALVKGMDMIGVIDCHVPEVLNELEQMIEQGNVIELEEGGLRFENVTLILGSEIEIYDEHCQGPIHVLVYFPFLEKMKQFTDWLEGRMKNRTLSSQRLYETGINLQRKVKELDGLFIPAHIFTPFKSLYGKGVNKSLEEVFDPTLIDAVELGLSSDTTMADQISELHHYPYLSNSDAHSLAKIAREYQVLKMDQPTFKELHMAIKGEMGRAIIANYGLDPRLGKYHRTSCEKCCTIIEDSDLEKCAACGHHRFTKGVYERLIELTDHQTSSQEINRPPYVHQVPLEFIPKLGPKTLAKLRDYFKTEMAIIHEAPEEALREVVSDAIVSYIMKARLGELTFKTGGAGRYGKVE